MEWPYFEPLHSHVLVWQEFCDALMEAFHDRLWKKFIHSCHSPSHRICLHGMEWRTDSKTKCLQDSLSKRHGVMLPSLQKGFDFHTLVLLYRIREKWLPIICSHYFPPSDRAHLAIRSDSTPILSPLEKKLPLSIAFCPEQSFFRTHSPLMFNHLSLKACSNPS